MQTQYYQSSDIDRHVNVFKYHFIARHKTLFFMAFIAFLKLTNTLVKDTKPSKIK